MYIIQLNLEKNIGKDISSLLAKTFADIAISSSYMFNDDSLVFKWLINDKPNIDDIASRLFLQIAAYNIKNIDISKENILIKKVEDINWLEKVYKGFEPFSIGHLYINSGDSEYIVPDGQISIKLDAATAFGSGEHETTRGCLQAMLDLKAKGACPWNILDMGTGSGVLAITAWKLWKSPVLAVDNDKESVRVAIKNAAINGISLSKTSLLCEYSNGFDALIIDKQKPYELIIANILASSVIEMAQDLNLVLDDRGYAILSGMLVEQSDLVISAYEGVGLRLIDRYDIGEWSTVIMQA